MLDLVSFYVWSLGRYYWKIFILQYGIKISSGQDLLITPIIGSVLGEIFFKWKGNIIRNDRKVLKSKILGETSLIIIDPFNMILNGLG